MTEKKGGIPSFVFYIGLAAVAFAVFKFQSTRQAPTAVAGFTAPPVTQQAMAQAREAALDVRTATPVDAYTQLFKRGIFEFEEAGQARALAYFFHAPEGSFPAGTKFPLVLLLHDTAGNAHAAQYLISKKVRTEYPAFVVVPELTKSESWASWMEPSLGFAADVEKHKKYGIHEAVELAKTIAVQFPVDVSRIYVVGCSEGGSGAFAAALYYPDVFAAAMSVSGGWRAGDAKLFGNTPIWAIHGALDRKVKPVASSGIITEMQKARKKNAFYTEVPGFGQDCANPSLYSAATWNWMFSQQKKRR